MPNFNQITIVGNLTREPECRYLPNGTAVCECGIAETQKRKKDGQTFEDTCFVDLVIWAQSGERFAEWFKKGESVLISGRLQLDQWEDRETGAKRSKHKINVRTFERCGSSKKRDSQPASTSDSVPDFESQQEIPVGDDVPF